IIITHGYCWSFSFFRPFSFFPSLSSWTSTSESTDISSSPSSSSSSMTTIPSSSLMTTTTTIATTTTTTTTTTTEIPKLMNNIINVIKQPNSWYYQIFSNSTRLDNNSNQQKSMNNISNDDNDDSISNNTLKNILDIQFDSINNLNESSSQLSYEYMDLFHQQQQPNDIQTDSESRKPFEALIQNDKTMADIVFDHTGRHLIYCELFDLEREPLPIRLPMVIANRRPLLVSHKTMLEAVQRCTQLALIQHQDVFIKNSNQTLTATMTLIDPTNIDNNSTTMSRIPSNNSTTNLSAPTLEMNFQNYWTFWKGILPGTKWCGLGDLSSHYEDLGTKVDIDLCCRAHDHCPIRLKAFRQGYGVFNFSFYSRLHCECDEDFYNCLKKSPNSYATMLGQFYFNVLRVQCLKEDGNQTSEISETTSTPQIVCRKRRLTKMGTNECLEYGVIPDSGVNQRIKIIPFGRYF
ncbi:hypothetical protein DERP_001734, partial [Dermatophagoides pteronyssinus]